MTDLYFGLAIMTLLSGVLFGLTWLAMRNAPMWVVDGLAGVVVVAIAVYARWVWEETYISRLLPCSNLIVVSNWFPLAAAIMAGLVWRRIGNKSAKFLGLGKGEFGSTPRKLFAAVVLFGAGFFSMIWPLLGEPPQCGTDWQGDVCLQTTPATCSAAAASTLLQYYGIYASEQEMANLCLTRQGTSWKGLYRGLKLKGQTVDRDVEVVNLTIDQLVQSFEEPCILQCELEISSNGDDFQFQMEGWVPGQPHSVVLLDVTTGGKQGDQFLIADPTAFVELWSHDHLRKLWHGQTLRMKPASHGS